MHPSSPTGPRMRAAVHHRYGGPEVVSVADLPVPTVGPRDLLLTAYASDVSVADHRLRARDLPRGMGALAAPVIGVRRPRRPVLGMEVAGVVAAVGRDVTTFHPGERVVAATGSRFGGHAELVRVPASGVVARVPESLTLEDAVALTFGGLTAHKFLRRADVTAGTEILVNGASGATGTIAVQLAARAGARVTAVCSDANADLVRDLGATDVVDHRTQDVGTLGHRFDVVVECVGNLPAARAIHLLRPGGTLLLVVADLVGTLGAPLDALRHRIRVVSGDLRTSAADLTHLLDLAATGALRPVVDRTYPLDEVVEAHRYVDTGRKRGAVVLRIRPEERPGSDAPGDAGTA